MESGEGRGVSEMWFKGRRITLNIYHNLFDLREECDIMFTRQYVGVLSFFIGKMENIFGVLATGDNPLVAVLAFTVATLAGVIVVQWRYMINKTVTYEVHKELMDLSNRMLGMYQTDFKNSFNDLKGRVNANIEQCQKTNAILNAPKK